MTLEEGMVEVSVLGEYVGGGTPGEETFGDEFFILCTGGVLVEELSFVVYLTVSAGGFICM